MKASRFLVLATLLGGVISPWGHSRAAARPAFCGMSYTPWSENVLWTPGSDQSIADMKAIHVDTVALNVWWFQDHVNSTVIAADFDYYSASTDSVVHAIQQIHAEGMRVMLKPMVDCRDGTWRGQIDPSTAWFAGYADFINYWADVAAAENVEALSVGCELKRTVGWSDSWRNVVSEVRARYPGELTYSANHDSYQSVDWWDALDYIGVDAYFPLTDQDDPTPAELQQAWQGLGNSLASWRNDRGYVQPIVFTEVGYRSGDGANRQPWAWGSPLPVDLQEQVDCYEAVLSTLWDEGWWEGAFWWNWETDPQAGGPSDDGYTPQNKPAENVLAFYYARPLVGDLDLDGDVDFDDYETTRLHFGQTEGASWADGDMDGDGDVDFTDYVTVKVNFGNSLPTSQTADQASVPEPATLTLLGMGVVALLISLVLKGTGAYTG